MTPFSPKGMVQSLAGFGVGVVLQKISVKKKKHYRRKKRTVLKPYPSLEAIPLHAAMSHIFRRKWAYRAYQSMAARYVLIWSIAGLPCALPVIHPTGHPADHGGENAKGDANAEEGFTGHRSILISYGGFAGWFLPDNIHVITPMVDANVRTGWNCTTPAAAVWRSTANICFGDKLSRVIKC